MLHIIPASQEGSVRAVGYRSYVFVDVLNLGSSEKKISTG